MTDETTDQASEQSVMDRLTSHMEHLTGKPEAEAEQAEPAQDVFEYELEGEKYQLPAKLKDHVMRQDDYTRKTQELADQRRTFDQVRETAMLSAMERGFNESVGEERNELAVIDAYLKQVGKTDWQTLPTEQLLRYKVEVDGIKERRAMLQQSLTAKRADYEKNFRTKMDELRGKAREEATKSIQGFSEDTEKAMRVFAKSEGLTDAELDSVFTDPRSYRIVYKAMQFDKVKSGTEKASQAVQAKAVKPGQASERMPADTRAKLDFNKALKAANTSGQKARVIEERLVKRFGG